jgi:hypothetical protein
VSGQAQLPQGGQDNPALQLQVAGRADAAAAGGHAGPGAHGHRQRAARAAARHADAAAGALAAAAGRGVPQGCAALLVPVERNQPVCSIESQRCMTERQCIPAPAQALPAVMAQPGVAMSPCGDCAILQVVDMGQGEYQRTWQQYINAFAEALIAAGADDLHSPAGKRVVSIAVLVGIAVYPSLSSLAQANVPSEGEVASQYRGWVADTAPELPKQGD